MTTDRRRGLSLETRIFLVSSLLIALLVGVSVAVTTLLLRNVARSAAAEALQASADVQKSFEREVYERHRLESQLFLTNGPVVAYMAEAMTQRDLPSILDILEKEGQPKLGFDFAILLDPGGQVVARTDNPNASGEDLRSRPLVANVLADFNASGVWREGNRLYYAVAVPVEKDLTAIGFLVTCFALTDKSANEINRASGGDLVFLSRGEGGTPQVAASTLSESTVRSLAAVLRGALGKPIANAVRDGREMSQTELDLAGQRWLVQETPLLEAEGKPVGAVLAMASLERELEPYRKIQNTLVGSGLAAVLLAPFLSYAFTRRAMGPVRRLVAATEGARQGNYDQKVDSADRTDEVGSLARAFRDLLADLREKRDMEAYVTELSRNLPEPQQGRPNLGEPQSRELILLGVELRDYARAGAGADVDPRDTLVRLSADCDRIARAAGRRRGQLEAVAGHRLVVRFEGRERATRALAVAGQILQALGETAGPAVVLSSGKVVTGPVHFGERSERVTVGQPVQQLDSLFREATAGDLLMSREVYEELRIDFERAGYQLAPRRGLVTPQPLYVANAAMATRVTGELEPGTTAQPVVLDASTTLSGISAGSLLGRRFEILAELGSGGMGVVYKARDRELDDLVALKMLKSELWGDKVQLERLKSEIKLARKITHPNVLRTHDFGEIDGVPYISMEYVRGVTLRFMLDQGRLPFSAALRLGKQLGAGLAAAHAVGVLHRDIKPENLILEPTGNAKLMDFGIARPIERMAPGQTQAGYIVGTPQYLAPEVLRGEEAGPRSDIYSCGIVLYEIFTGVLPFNAPTAMDVIMMHLKEPPAPPSQAWAEIPRPLEAAILRCLSKDLEGRYASVEELLHDLEALSA